MSDDSGDTIDPQAILPCERVSHAASASSTIWAAKNLAANGFRITQAEAKMRRDGVDNKGDANRTHYAVGKKVRETIADLGGTMPEELPTPEQSIQQLERAEQKRIAARQQPSLFLTDTRISMRKQPLAQLLGRGRMSLWIVWAASGRGPCRHCAPSRRSPAHSRGRWRGYLCDCGHCWQLCPRQPARRRRPG